MNKQNVFKKYLLWQTVLPVAAGCILTLIYCILYSNYYYLPSWLDFSIGFTYQVSYIVITLCMYVSIGIAYYCIMFLKTKEILLSALIPFVFYSVIPFILLIEKTIFFTNASSPVTGDEFRSLMESDYLFFFENISKYSLAILFISVVALVLKKGLKKEASFSKPYVLPKGAVQETALVYYLAWFIYSFVLFLISEDKNVVSILTEFAYALAGYLLCVYGSTYINKLFNNNEKVNKKT